LLDILGKPFFPCTWAQRDKEHFPSILECKLHSTRPSPRSVRLIALFSVKRNCTLLNQILRREIGELRNDVAFLVRRTRIEKPRARDTQENTGYANAARLNLSWIKRWLMRGVRQRGDQFAWATNFVRRQAVLFLTRRIGLIKKKKKNENIEYRRGLIGTRCSFMLSDEMGDEKQRNIPSRKSGHSPPLRSRVLLRRTVSRHPASSVLPFAGLSSPSPSLCPFLLRDSLSLSLPSLSLSLPST